MNALPIDYEQCCNDRLNPPHKADIAQSMTHGRCRRQSPVATVVDPNQGIDQHKAIALISLLICFQLPPDRGGMIMRKLIGMIIVGAMLVVAQVARADSIVLLDYWWLNDYANESCREVYLSDESDRRTACLNPTAEANNYKTELETQFTIEAQCHGITFVPFGGPNTPFAAASKAVVRPHWTLIIDFVPGHITQGWNLQTSVDSKTMFEGNGTLPQISRDVCAAISKRGGTISP